jgi:hypothetical protein
MGEMRVQETGVWRLWREAIRLAFGLLAWRGARP